MTGRGFPVRCNVIIPPSTGGLRNVRVPGLPFVFSRLKTTTEKAALEMPLAKRGGGAKVNPGQHEFHWFLEVWKRIVPTLIL